VTESESHPSWRSLQREPGDVGGDFTTQKSVCYTSTDDVHIDTGWFGGPNPYERYIYDGPCRIDEASFSGKVAFPSAAASSDAALNAFGSTAIAKCAPTKPTANLATALLEAYHDGLPKLIGAAAWKENTQSALSLRNSAKSGSGEFLNYQFGWLPLVSDVTDFIGAVTHMDKLLQQYIRDNGQVVRRRFTFPPEITVSEVTVASQVWPYLGSNNTSLLNTSGGLPRGDVIRRRQTTINRWFSGAFVYHLPMTFFRDLYTPFASDFQVYRKILGADLTPEVIWELTPWSWAIDWFSNVGDVITNANSWANDGLVMKYGYIMEHSIVHDIYTFVGPTNIRGGSTVRPPDINLVVETKLRRKANPFGFGLTMGGLSTLQKSILAAVGLTRLR
jgi:hypothetical protein